MQESGSFTKSMRSIVEKDVVEKRSLGPSVGEPLGPSATHPVLSARIGRLHTTADVAAASEGRC
jgi:hypothetical protein